MSIAIDLTESAPLRGSLDHRAIVTRTEVKKVGKDQNEVAQSHDASTAHIANEKQLLAVRLASTLTLLILFTASFALTAWMFVDLAGSAMDQILVLSPHQIIQSMSGR
jgi:hypothetical protein